MTDRHLYLCLSDLLVSSVSQALCLRPLQAASNAGDLIACFVLILSVAMQANHYGRVYPLQ